MNLIKSSNDALGGCDRIWEEAGTKQLWSFLTREFVVRRQGKLDTKTKVPSGPGNEANSTGIRCTKPGKSALISEVRGENTSRGVLISEHHLLEPPYLRLTIQKRGGVGDINLRMELSQVCHSEEFSLEKDIQ